MSPAADDPALYFAYGSNLRSSRLRERIGSVRVVCAARLDDRRLSLAKHGRDGSGKATLVEAVGGIVWGVVYAIDAGDWPRLDAFERGYTRTRVRVASERFARIAATTYVAPETAPDPRPFAWYKQLIVEGAREHGLPAAYVAELEQLPARDEAGGLS